MNDSASPISLDLFNRVDDYTDSILKGTTTRDSDINSDTAIFIFYYNFFLQFFQNVLHQPITGFDERAQDQAARLRFSLGAPENAPLRQLIVQFENFCELQSESGRGLYLPSDEDFLEFHEQYIPRLLESIGGWAMSAGLPELAERAKRAFDHYNSAVAYLRKNYG